MEKAVEKICTASMEALVRLYPEVAKASDSEIERAVAAMRAAARDAVDEMFTDVRDVPHLAGYCARTAVLTIAAAGIRSLRGED